MVNQKKRNAGGYIPLSKSVISTVTSKCETPLYERKTEIAIIEKSEISEYVLPTPSRVDNISIPITISNNRDGVENNIVSLNEDSQIINNINSPCQRVFASVGESNDSVGRNDVPQTKLAIEEKTIKPEIVNTGSKESSVMSCVLTSEIQVDVRNITSNTLSTSKDVNSAMWDSSSRSHVPGIAKATIEIIGELRDSNNSNDQNVICDNSDKLSQDECTAELDITVMNITVKNQNDVVDGDENKDAELNCLTSSITNLHHVHENLKPTLRLKLFQIKQSSVLPMKYSYINHKLMIARSCCG